MCKQSRKIFVCTRLLSPFSHSIPFVLVYSIVCYWKLKIGKQPVVTLLLQYEKIELSWNRMGVGCMCIWMWHFYCEFRMLKWIKIKNERKKRHNQKRPKVELWWFFFSLFLSIQTICSLTKQKRYNRHSKKEKKMYIDPLLKIICKHFLALAHSLWVIRK